MKTSGNARDHVTQSTDARQHSCTVGVHERALHVAGVIHEIGKSAERSTNKHVRASEQQQFDQRILDRDRIASIERARGITNKTLTEMSDKLLCNTIVCALPFRGSTAPSSVHSNTPAFRL